MNARLSFNTACELGFRGSLDEWERLMGAVAKTLVSRTRSNSFSACSRRDSSLKRCDEIIGEAV